MCSAKSAAFVDFSTTIGRPYRAFEDLA